MSPRQMRILLLAVLATPWAIRGSADAEIAQEIEAYLNSFEGTELPVVSTTIDLSGVGVTVDLLGFALCMPPNPTAEPVIPALPPANSYGCVNAAEVVGTPVADPPGVDLVLSIDPFFVDLQTARDATILCGDLGGGTVSDGAYVTVTVQLSGRVRYVEQNGCVRWVAVPGSEDFSISTPAAFFEDGCLGAFAGLAGDLLASTLEEQLRTVFLDAIDDFLWNRNLDTCGAPVETKSWAAVKARFDSPGPR